MNFKPFYILFVLALATFAACQKDNIDSTDINNNTVKPDTTGANCDSFSVTIHAVIFPDTSNLTAVPVGGTMPYTYLWSTGQTNETIFVTSNGVYGVTVTAANGCTTAALIMVDSSGNNCGSLIGSISENGGLLYASGTGGVAPYGYQWSTGAITQAITPTSNGVYHVTIYDAAGCSTVASYNYTNGGSNSCATLGVAMSDSTGTLFANAYGGTAPYTYQWSTGATTPAIIAPGNGIYSVIIMDANGCTVSGVINYTGGGNPCASLTVAIQWDSVSVLTALVNGGTAPYLYQWSTGANTQSINAQPGNAYNVIVADGAGCTVAKNIQL